MQDFARYFVVVDTESLEVVQVIDNEKNQQASHGAGGQSAQVISDSGAEWVITGNVGPRAFDVLTGAGIKIGVGAMGIVRDAVNDFKEGKFDAHSSPTNPGHPG